MAASAPTVQPSGEPASPAPRRLAAALRRLAAALRRLAAVLRGGAWLRGVGLGGAMIPALMLVFILIALLIKALPAIQINGWSFFTKSVWVTGSYNAKTVTSHGITYLAGQDYGAFPQIVGTLETSAIALIIGVPISIGAALLIVERLPGAIGRFVGVFLELLAGIPSVVIGLWGVLTFGPFLANDITPFIARNMPDIPVLNFFRGNTGSGEGLLTSGLILAIMIIPIIASTARDLIRQVPILPREGAIALGMSDAETARRVTLPWVGSGLVGATVLGLGRALGETIAVAMVCGVRFGSIASNLYDTMVTVAANIIQNLDTVITDQRGLRTYAELALVLLVITLTVNVIARLLVKRVSGVSLPVGRGL